MVSVAAGSSLPGKLSASGGRSVTPVVGQCRAPPGQRASRQLHGARSSGNRQDQPAQSCHALRTPKRMSGTRWRVGGVGAAEEAADTMADVDVVSECGGLG